VKIKSAWRIYNIYYSTVGVITNCTVLKKYKMIITDKIRERLGTWTDLFKPFIESSDGEFDRIFKFLKAQSHINRKVVPISENIFKSFELCPRNTIKAIIVLMDPYPSITKDSIIIADGVPLSCKNIGYPQPSLDVWYTGIEKTYKEGFDFDIDHRLDTSYLLTEEGVLLLNSSLTCEKDKPGSHFNIWLPFMKYFFEDIIGMFYSGLPIVLAGAQAQKLEKYINPLTHYILKIEHPVASYAKREWDNKNCFNWCNNIIEKNNGKEFIINWKRDKSEAPKIQTPKDAYTKPNLPSAEALGLPWKD